MGVAAVRGDRARRSHLWTRLRRLEVEHPQAHGRAAGVGGQATGRDQDRHRGPGGDRQRLHDLPADPARPVRRGRDGDRGHGEHPPRRADAHDRPPWDGSRHHRGADAGRPQALGPVRRRGARCTPRRAPRARVDARRARRRGGGWTASRGVEWSVLLGRGVPRARGDRGGDAVHRLGRARRAPLVRSGAHGDRHRRAVGRRGRERRRAVRAREGEHAPPPGGGSGRSSGHARTALREPEAVRDRARRACGRNRQGLLRRDDGARVRRCPRRPCERLGHGHGLRGDRRLDPARECPERGSATCGGPDVRHDRRVREHPCAERARAPGRIREGRPCRDRVFGRYAKSFEIGRATS